MIMILLFSLFRFFDTEPANRIPVTDFSSFETYLDRKNDTVYVLNFWASWCVPCREELPDFERLHKTYQSERVKVLLISLDMPDQIESRLIPFLDKNNITAEVILLDDPDFNGWINKIDSTWGGGIPATLIYNKDYRVFLDRKTNFEELENIVKPKLIKL